jgi:ubiquinone/menaquinone biosynthesis C-methylase UbiE
MRCIDIGCGGGAVTLEMARLIAPGGSVTGLDMDEVKLGLAREAAAERELDNVEFRKLDVNDWNEPGAYDFVFSRFLLQHLVDPTEVLGRMWAGVRPRGVLVVEDADFDGWCCDPPNEAFDFFVRSYGRVLERRGGDHALGRKLYRSFRGAGISEPDVALVQSVSVAGEEKTLAWSTLESTAEAIVSERIASEDEVTAALASLWQFTKDPHTLICHPRVFQLCSRR